MKLSRTAQVRILKVLNNLLPPFIRDARWFMKPPMRLVFGDHAELVMAFKENAPSMSDEEFRGVYARLRDCALGRETDLNDACLRQILSDTVGSSVLEVGCGAGLLARSLARRHDVTACDIVIDGDLQRQNPTITFCEADAEALPFPDDGFDTVVCTHTLEHVRNFHRATGELRRVARQRLIVVVPLERPYRYTFNLHLHFFAYPHSFEAAMGAGTASRSSVLDGDLYYLEDCHSRLSPGLGTAPDSDRSLSGDRTTGR